MYSDLEKHITSYYESNIQLKEGTIIVFINKYDALDYGIIFHVDGFPYIVDAENKIKCLPNEFSVVNEIP